MGWRGWCRRSSGWIHSKTRCFCSAGGVKKQFGTSSEQAKEQLDGQLSLLFNEAEAIAHIMTQKFVMASPLYRQEQEWARQGLKLSRQTMSNWVLYADETTLQALHEPGKKAQTKSYMWLYRTGRDGRPPIVLYEYQPNRKAEHAVKFLEGFPGISTRTATRAITGCRRISRWLAAGLTPGGSSTRRSTPCRRTRGRARRLELSNNRAERSIKPFVIGRKNFLFANTPLGAQASAVIYSLIESVKETELALFRYLT